MIISNFNPWILLTEDSIQIDWLIRKTENLWTKGRVDYGMQSDHLSRLRDIFKI